MLRLVPPMLVALVEALAAIGTARAIHRLARRSSDGATWLDRSLSAHLLVGLPLYGTLLFLAGLFSTSTITVCAITIPLAFYAIVDSIASRHGHQTGNLPRTRDLFGALALATAGIISFLFAQLPSFTLDELAYHLAVPMQWIIGGRVEAFPLISSSWFPFGLESADLFALRLLGHDGGVASHFVHLFCGVALTSLLARRLAGESATPLLFTAAIITTPALLVTAGWSWNDVSLIGIVVVLFLALDEPVHSTHTLALTGLAVSAGLLTKYTFVPIALLLFGAAFTHFDREKRRALLRAVAIGAVAGSIFFVRNALLTGNPIAPILASGIPAMAGYRSTRSFLETIGSYIFDLRFVDEALGVSLLLLTFFSIGRAQSRFSRRASLALLTACAVLALLTPSARILLPFLAIPALAGGRIVRRLGVAARRVVAIVIGVAVAAQLTEAALYLAAHRPLSLLTGESSIANWLTHQRPVASDVLWIDAALPAHSRTLILGIQEIFWFDHPVRGGGDFDGPRIAAYLRAGDAQRLRERLRHDGITHVAIGRGLVLEPSADIKRRERETLLDTTTANTLTDLLLKQRIVAKKGPIMIFELR